MRKNVWSLPAGDATLDWYRRAIEVLLARKPDDPTSWTYMAGVHGAYTAPPSGADPFWNQCQHQSWYFLPWHRAYITCLEAVVAGAVAGLGGPADWALPYWDYSQDTSKQPNARLLPTAFRDAKLAGGGRNALWATRARVSNGDFSLTDDVVTLDALKSAIFAGGVGGGSPGFGGPRTGFNHFRGVSGLLENVPHNVVHGQIGGWMGDPNTAALDPIFWLHHCNIDRLWEVWRNADPKHRSPKDASWLTTQSFGFHDAKGAAVTFTGKDVLDTSKLMHGYCYDSTPPVHEVVAMADTGESGGGAGDEPPAQGAELVGASDGTSVALEEGVAATLSLPLSPERSAFSFTDSAKRRPEGVFLNVENVTGAGVPGDIAIAVKPSDHDDFTPVGLFGTFGVALASQEDGDHGGGGVTQVFDLTDLAEALGLSDGSATELSVNLERRPASAVDDAEPPEEIRVMLPDNMTASLSVGRVSLFFAGAETSEGGSGEDTSGGGGSGETLVAGGGDDTTGGGGDPTGGGGEGDPGEHGGGGEDTTGGGDAPA